MSAKVRVILVHFLLILMAASPAGALNQPTHDIVNEQAGLKSQLDTVLREVHGFQDGIQQQIRGQRAFQWLRIGGTREDDGDVLGGKARFLRHFHNPLEPWGEAGLDLIVKRHMSSVHWMQRANQETEARGTGDWAWADARRYYHQALTAEEPDARDRAWADTLRAVGQIMHLIVDASVPEHTRNDPHPLGYLFGNYEYWILAQHGPLGSRQEADFIQRYLSQPVGFDAAILRTPTGDPRAPVPVARLIDTDTYAGTDPNVTLSPAIGIAEFAHANFFSEDTGKPHLFSPLWPFPSLERLQPSRHPAPHTGRARAYYRKGPGDGLPVDPVLAECVLDEMAVAAGLQPTERCTDENVWAAVASVMLPRAVGYAAGALDYFFRGRLDARFKVYRDGATLRGRVTVRNPTAEDMDGTLAVHYEVRSGRRTRLTEVPLALAAGATSEVELGVLPHDAPVSPWIFVFKGRLGLEADAIAAARAGARFLSRLFFFARESPNGLDEYDAPAEDVSEAEPLPLLLAVDTIVRRTAVFPQGTSGEIDRLKVATVYHVDPTAPVDRLDLLAALFNLCGGSDDVFYLDGFYRHLNSFVGLPVTAASAQLVEFEPPSDLATLFGYTYRDPPAMRRVLVDNISTGAVPSVNLTGVIFFGVRLTSVPTVPGIPGGLAPEGFPFVTSGRGCQIGVPAQLSATAPP